MISQDELSQFCDKYFGNEHIDILTFIEKTRKEIVSHLDKVEILYGDVVFGFVAGIGNHVVSEIYKDIDKEYNVVYKVGDIHSYPLTMKMYLACLIDKANPGGTYSVTLRFESEEDEELFDSYGNDLMRIIMSENPLSKIKHEHI